MKRNKIERRFPFHRHQYLFLKFLVIFYLILGLLFFISTTFAKKSILKIKNISNMKTDSFIRIKGFISGNPKFYKKSNSLILRVNDFTGKLNVVLFKNVAIEIRNKYNPELGDIIDAEGILERKDSFVSLKILSADNFFLTKSKIIKIEDLDSRPLQSIVKIQGTIKKIYSIKNGRKMIITDGTGDVNLILWDSIGRHLVTSIHLEKNKTFIFKGILKKYKGKLEIIPQYSDNIISVKE